MQGRPSKQLVIPVKLLGTRSDISSVFLKPKPRDLESMPRDFVEPIQQSPYTAAARDEDDTRVAYC
ncbi:MAG: hypothetical protein ACI9NT_001834 [Bacteroidia bacterium]|jgi:hypothetical protein